MKSSFFFLSLVVSVCYADVQYPLSDPPAGGRSKSLNKYTYGPGYDPKKHLVYLQDPQDEYEYEFEESFSFEFEEFEEGDRRRGLRGST